MRRARSRDRVGGPAPPSAVARIRSGPDIALRAQTAWSRQISSLGGYQAPVGWFTRSGLFYSVFFFENSALMLSNSSILAPCRCMMIDCWITDSVLFHAQ